MDLSLRSNSRIDIHVNNHRKLSSVDLCLQDTIHNTQLKSEYIRTCLYSRHVFSVYCMCLQNYTSVFCSKYRYGVYLHHSLYFCIFVQKNMQCCCWTKNLVIELGSTEIKQIDTKHEWIKVQLQHVSFQEQLNLEVDLSTNSGGSAELWWTLYLSSLEGGGEGEGGRETRG